MPKIKKRIHHKIEREKLIKITMQLVIEITFDEIFRGGPTSDGGGGHGFLRGQWISQFLNELGKAMRLGRGWRDPVRGSGEERKPIGC